MPRTARIKNDEAIYHIMVRSISEIDLFRDNEDKVKYLSIIRRCQLKYKFAVYAYCLMDNHGHLIVDSLGGDISRIMHYTNFCYAQYYNRKYKRHGHVFQDRFKSKIVDSEKYIITLSAYIHNNPKDIVGYKDRVHLYPFSSLKEYINETNTFGILSRAFLTSLLGLKYKENRRSYISLVRKSVDAELKVDIEFDYTETEYQSHRNIIIRNSNHNDVITYVAEKLSQDSNNIYIKYRRGCCRIRAVSCLLMSVFCNMNQKEICQVIGNITQSGISYLTARGLEIISKDNSLIKDFIEQ